MTDLFSFGEPSTLHMRTGWGSGMVSSWCFCMKLPPVYEHTSSSGVQEHGHGDRCKGGEGGELDLDVKRAGGVLLQDIDGRQRDYCKGFLNLFGCGFSLVTLGRGRTSSITMVCTIQSIRSEQPGRTLHWLQL